MTTIGIDLASSATRDAARIAGVEVVRSVNEPAATGRASGLGRLGHDLRIAVIDFVGGALDLAVMQSSQGVFEAKSTGGDTQLRGTDMNRLVFESLADGFRPQTGFDVRHDREASARRLELRRQRKSS